MSDKFADPADYRRRAAHLEIDGAYGAARTLREAAQAIDDARAQSHERRPTVSDNEYAMPSAQQLKEANDVIHQARMALHDDDHIKKQLLPIPGWEYVSAVHLVHKGLDAGHEALWLLYCAVHQQEAEQAKMTGPAA